MHPVQPKQHCSYMFNDQNQTYFIIRTIAHQINPNQIENIKPNTDNSQPKKII